MKVLATSVLLTVICSSVTVGVVGNGAGTVVGSGLGTALSTMTGILGRATKVLPTPLKLFESAIELVGGYPFEVLFSAINEVCSGVLTAGLVRPRLTPKIEEIKMQLFTISNVYSYPVQNVSGLLANPEFDPSKQVVILAAGWTRKVNGTSEIEIMAKAYNCRGSHNFMAVDIGSYLRTLYTWSAFNTVRLGEYVAVGLVGLTRFVPLENIHLIGHSLGSHIVSSAGRHFRLLTGRSIPRITGLDPAKPCFNKGDGLTGLMRGDGDFVDVIHSNPGVLGKREPLGDVDFYPGGLSPLTSGCLTIICAHLRAVRFYAESVYPGQERNFVGTRCNSLGNLRAGRCPNERMIMGFGTPSYAEGNYFMDVRPFAPYGQNGNSALWQSYKQCGLPVGRVF